MSMRIWWNDVNRYPRLTVGAAVGLVGMAALAVFGLPPIGLHTPLRYVGVVCPLCGMTRAMRLLARGEISEAISYNPASPLVLAGGIALMARLVVGYWTGRWIDALVRWTPTTVAAVVVGVGTLWVHQQTNAELLIHGPTHH